MTTENDGALDLPRRPLGKTGVKLPVLGLGTAPAGHRPEAEAVAFFHRCLDLGVTHLDTGPALGGFGQAQRYLATVLAERREEAFVATRCCVPDGEAALAQLRENLADLGIERADLVYVQSLGNDEMTPERIYAANGVCRALKGAKADGLTRFLGVSGHHRPGRFLEALQNWDFDVMLTAANLVTRHSYGFESAVWPEAEKRGIALLAMKVFGGVADGRLSAKGAALPEPLQADGLRYALGLPGASGVLLGMVDEAELQQNLTRIRGFSPLTAAELARLEAPTEALAAEWGEIYGPRG